MYSVNRSGINGKWFIMNNVMNSTGKPIGQIGKYFDSMKEATIEMLKHHNPNLYSLSEKKYAEMVAK